MYNHQLEQNEKDSFYYYLGKKYTILYDESIKKYKLEDDYLFCIEDWEMTFSC